MKQLTRKFVESCATEGGFYLRGEQMTRIEVFVDAAFAFAVTMLVISIDAIPTSVPELIAASKQIPAFIVCVAQLIWIWHSHAVWSNRFGLEDGIAILLSSVLLIIVLIYIYPLKMMFGGFFMWISNGYLPSDFDLTGIDELRFLFVYFGIGFIAISVTFVLMQWHALRHQKELLLIPKEIHKTITQIQIRWALAGVALLAVVLALLTPDPYVPYTGFTYMLIGLMYPLIEQRRQLIWQRQVAASGSVNEISSPSDQSG